MQPMQDDVTICTCGSPEHMMLWRYDPDDGQVYVEIHLSQSKGFFKRLRRAINYVFGYKCKYGSFDEVIIDPEDADKIIKYMNLIKEHAKNLAMGRD